MKELKRLTFDEYFNQQLDAFIKTLEVGEFTFNLINVDNRNPDQVGLDVWKQLIYDQSQPNFYN